VQAAAASHNGGPHAGAMRGGLSVSHLHFIAKIELLFMDFYYAEL
jgi:hypothetical protein